MFLSWSWSRIFLTLVLFNVHFILPRDYILEFKGAYFVPTNSTFRKAYSGGALYGPEFTMQLKKDTNWYLFTSIDYFQQKGRFLEIADSTKLRLLSLALGVKYIKNISNRTNFYLGLGFEPAYIRTKSKRRCVVAKKSQWGFGGVGKMGAYINLSDHLLCDLFFDYRFIKTRKKNFYGHTRTPDRANLSGAIFGIGLGYLF